MPRHYIMYRTRCRCNVYAVCHRGTERQRVYRGLRMKGRQTSFFR